MALAILSNFSGHRWRSDYRSDMASLTKDSRGRSPYYFCCYTSADGRRLKKSTKQTHRAKALEVCLALERAEGMAARGALTETRARELIGEVLERTTGDSLPFYTAEAWLREWLRGKQVSKSEGTHVKYAHTVESFIEHLGPRANINVSAISTKDIAAFRDAEIANGKNPNTVRYLIKHLRIPFNAARRQGLLTHNPAESVELPSVAKTEDGAEASRDPFSPDQINALMNAATIKEEGNPIFKAGDEWRGAILTAYYTGARLQDVVNLTWDAVDLPRKLITYRARKTGKPVAVPIHPELESYLLDLPAPDNGRAFVFPKLAGNRTGGRSGLSMTFSRIMARARIASAVIHAKKPGGKGRTVRTLTFHSLRHSFNSALANAGVAQEIRMKLTGHASAGMNTGYTHHEVEPLRAAIRVIPSLGLRD
jgi:integrase